ncbi:MAG: FixH family protein [Halioglobus sp.]
MNNPAHTDTLPWYRQFWPWFLIMLPASVVVAGLTTVYIAHEGADDLVIDEYYKNGLAINRQLEKIERASTAGIAAELEFSAHSVAVTISGDVTAEKLNLTLSHPLEADRDFLVVLTRIEPGFYAAVLEQAIFSRWHWSLENQDQPRWRLDGTVNLDSASNDSVSPD